MPSPDLFLSCLTSWERYVRVLAALLAAFIELWFAWFALFAASVFVGPLFVFGPLCCPFFVFPYVAELFPVLFMFMFGERKKARCCFPLVLFFVSLLFFSILYWGPLMVFYFSFHFYLV